MSNNPTSVHKEHNNIKAMGITGAYGSFIDGTSSSRIGMVVQHKGQSLVIRDPQLPDILTGTEQDLANYIAGTKTKSTIEIIDIINDQPDPYNPHLIPRSYLIFKDLDKGNVIDALVVEKYYNYHYLFGFETHLTDIASNLNVGDVLEPNTVLSTTANVKDGLYSTGRMANVLYIADESNIEDGFEINKDWIDRTSALAIKEVTCNIGAISGYYPLFLYGKEGEWKICPDVGEQVRDDLLILALRKVNPDTVAIDFSPEELRIPRQSDILFYATDPRATVLEIDVIDSTLDNTRKLSMSTDMARQLKKYSVRKHELVHSKIIEIYNRYNRENQYNQNMFGPTMLRLVKEAFQTTPNELVKSNPLFINTNGSRNKINTTFRAALLDEFKITIKYGFWYQPGLTAKYTGNFGDKGVACAITPNEEMDIDEYGNRVDIKIHTNPSTKRLNAIQLLEHYINGTTREVMTDIREMVKNNEVDKAVDFLKQYMSIVSPIDLETFGNYPMTKQRAYVKEITTKNDKYRPTIPADNDWIDPIKTVDAINAFRPPNKCTVYFYNKKTKQMEPYKDPMLVAPRHFVTLEKMDGQAMSVSLGTLQHHGTLSSLNKTTKSSFPSHRKPPRVVGNSESRVAVNADGARNLAHVSDISNNPKTQQEVAKAIFTAENPSHMETVVDRDDNPLGTARNLQLVRHVFACYGTKLSPGNKPKEQDK